VIGNGVVSDLDQLFSADRFPSNHKHAGKIKGEILRLKEGGIDIHHRLKLSSRSILITDVIKKYDQYLENFKNNKIGTTGKGIGPA